MIEWRTTQKGGWTGAVADLVELKPDVIVVPSTQPAMAAKQLTRTPIVTCAASDVVDTGLVSSLTRSGVYITGFTVSGGDLSRKRVELLKELVPTVALVAVLADSTNATHTVFWKAMEEAAHALGIRVPRVEARAAEEFDSALNTIAKLRPDAFIVFPEPLSYSERKRIGEFTVKQHLPAVFALRGHVVEGGLVSYEPNQLTCTDGVPAMSERSSRALSSPTFQSRNLSHSNG